MTVGRSADRGQGVITAPPKLIGGMAWVTAEKAVTLTAGFASGLLLTRLMDQTGFGIFVLLASVVRVGGLLGRAGIDTAAVKLIAEREDAHAIGVLLTCLAYAAVGLTIVALALWSPVGHWVVASAFSSSGSIAAIPGASCWLVAEGLQLVIAGALRGAGNMRAASLFGGILDRSVFVGVLYVAWSRGVTLTPKEALSINAALIGMSVVLGMAYVVAKVNWSAPTTWLGPRRVFHLSIPFLGTSLSYALFAYAGVWILKAFRPETDVAIYGAAARLSVLMSAPLLVLEAVLNPVLVRLQDQDALATLESVSRSLAGIIGIPSLLLIGTAMLFSGRVLGLVYGPGYVSGGGVLAVMCLGQLINVWTGACTPLLNMTGRHIITTKIAIVSTLVMGILGLILTPRLGMVGTALASASAVIIQNITMLLIIRRTIGIRADMSLLPDFGILARSA